MATTQDVNRVQPHELVKVGGKLEKIVRPEHAVNMKTTSTELMEASKQCCPNEACSARGQIGAGNIRIHS